MLSKLVRLLALLLVPVLVMSTGETARAATFGPVATATFQPMTGYGQTIDCSLSAFWSVPNSGSPTVQVRDFSCSSGFNISGIDMSLSVAGSTCSMTGYFGQMDGTGVQTGMLGGSYAAPEGCNITALCWQADVQSHTNPWVTEDIDGCAPIALGMPPVETPPSQEGCFDLPGGMAAPSIQVTNGPGAYRNMRVEVTVGPTALNGATVVVTSWYTANGVLGWNTFSSFVVGAGQSMTKVFNHGPGWENQTVTPVGVQVTVTGPALQAAPSWNNNPQLNRTVRNVNSTVAVGSVEDLKMGGVHWPARCSFYMGGKIAQDVNNTYDDPGGVLPGGTVTPPVEPVTDTPPPTEETNCAGFTLTDPASWGPAASCAIARLLMSVVGLLGDVLEFLGGLIASIGDMIRSLFIPDEGFFDGKVNEVKDAWADTAPMVFVDGVQEVGGAFVIGAPSGCQGPDLTISSPVGGGSHTLSPLSACGGAMSNLASLVKIALTVLVYVGGFLAAVRIVGAAFGIDASIGRGDDA